MLVRTSRVSRHQVGATTTARASSLSTPEVDGIHIHTVTTVATLTRMATLVRYFGSTTYQERTTLDTLDLYVPPGSVRSSPDRLRLRLTPPFLSACSGGEEESNPTFLSLCPPIYLRVGCIVPLMDKSSHYDLITHPNVDTTSRGLRPRKSGPVLS